MHDIAPREAGEHLRRDWISGRALERDPGHRQAGDRFSGSQMGLQAPKQAIEGDDPNVPSELDQTKAQMQNGFLDPASIRKKLSDNLRNQRHAIASAKSGISSAPR